MMLYTYVIGILVGGVIVLMFSFAIVAGRAAKKGDILLDEKLESGTRHENGIGPFVDHGSRPPGVMIPALPAPSKSDYFWRAVAIVILSLAMFLFGVIVATIVIDERASRNESEWAEVAR